MQQDISSFLVKVIRAFKRQNSKYCSTNKLTVKRFQMPWRLSLMHLKHICPMMRWCEVSRKAFWSNKAIWSFNTFTLLALWRDKKRSDVLGRHYFKTYILKFDVYMKSYISAAQVPTKQLYDNHFWIHSMIKWQKCFP